ncbi:Os12g0626150 [Oryza sativa Japonica Group]|uniref:Os12g0626150 protein n=1 Tax=Oryza sativa subsp. japonica TaxID=39947 RepID=A0A0P0YCW8_ORYSJ|nr:hypothetical protein EE612_061061 [Oryza sativa]BAT18183.1 Os12g0626150 [Oryza sativa Japonica Group]
MPSLLTSVSEWIENWRLNPSPPNPKPIGGAWQGSSGEGVRAARQRLQGRGLARRSDGAVARRRQRPLPGARSSRRPSRRRRGRPVSHHLRALMPGNAAPAAAPDGRLPAAEDEQLALDDVAGISELAKCFFSAHKVPVQDDATGGFALQEFTA